MGRKGGDNPVRQAVEKVGGVQEAARICGVRERSIDRWRARGYINDFRAAVALARKSGITVEKFAPPEPKKD